MALYDIRYNWKIDSCSTAPPCWGLSGGQWWEKMLPAVHLIVQFAWKDVLLLTNSGAMKNNSLNDHRLRRKMVGELATSNVGEIKRPFWMGKKCDYVCLTWMFTRMASALEDFINNQLERMAYPLVTNWLLFPSPLSSTNEIVNKVYMEMRM